MKGFDISNEDPTQRFEFLSKVGEGSYGSVYKALDRVDNMIVAVKVLDMQNDEAASEDIAKEINILKTCSNNPNIVAYKGSYLKDSKLWIAMEYCGVGSISDLMAICDTCLSELEIAAILKESLNGLAYLHREKKIHRDIKSGNLLLTQDGRCKLADFGVSAELTNTLAKRNTLIGTPYFMAPEVLRNSAYDAKADIWSLGITAYELAVGSPPFADVHPMRAIFLIPNSDPPTLPDPHNYSVEFNDFLSKCLQKDPDNRMSAQQLLQHPFLSNIQPQNIIMMLVENSRKHIEEFRRLEALEQAANNSNQPSDGPSAGYDDATMVAHHTSNGTMISGQDTMVPYSAATIVSGTMVNNDYSTMVARNDYNTMVSHDSTMKVTDNSNHFGTMKMIKTNPAPVVVGPVDPDAPVLNLQRTSKLFSAVNVNSTADDIDKVTAEIQSMYEVDIKALQNYYMKKMECLRKISDSKKKRR